MIRSFRPFHQDFQVDNQIPLRSPTSSEIVHFLSSRHMRLHIQPRKNYERAPSRRPCPSWQRKKPRARPPRSGGAGRGAPSAGRIALPHVCHMFFYYVLFSPFLKDIAAPRQRVFYYVVESICKTPGQSVHGERANFTRLVLGGGGGGRPDYLQKLKVLGCIEAKFCK